MKYGPFGEPQPTNTAEYGSKEYLDWKKADDERKARRKHKQLYGSDQSEAARWYTKEVHRPNAETMRFNERLVRDELARISDPQGVEAKKRDLERWLRDNVPLAEEDDE